jgi:hypothetical protein
MKALTSLLPVLSLALLTGAGGVQAAEGWFGGLQVAPWISRADALLNLDHGAELPARKLRGSVLPIAPAHRFDVELAYAVGPAPAPSAGRPAPGVTSVSPAWAPGHSTTASV